MHFKLNLGVEHGKLTSQETLLALIRSYIEL